MSEPAFLKEFCHLFGLHHHSSGPSDEQSEPLSTGDQISVIYQTFNDMMRNGKFRELNLLISVMDARNMPLDIALAVLTASSWSKALPAIKGFYNKVAKRWDVRFRPGLLSGLEP